MGKPTLLELQQEELFDYHSDSDSENKALQEAFARGDLKPGLNFIGYQGPVKTNNVPLLKGALEDLKQNLPWIERLDVVSKLAPLAPELSLQLQETEKGPNALVFDEFKRESVFYRHAQNAVMSVLPILKQKGLITERPDDYLAEMAKSDNHMQKVKADVIKKKLMMDRIEKLREIRSQKKVQKALNAQAKVAKVQSKKDFNDEIKKYKKGQTKSLDFLQPGYKPKAKTNKSQMKKNYKESKYGRGGKKRGLKKNTRDSTSGFDGRAKKPTFNKAGGKKAGSNKMQGQKRAGKNMRMKMKSKKNNN